MKNLKLLLLTSLFVIIAGCAAFATPKTFDDKMAYAYGTHASVVNSVAQLVETGKIPKAKGQEELDIAKQIRAALDAAWQAHDMGNGSSAETQLALAMNLLSQLEVYLQSQGK